MANVLIVYWSGTGNTEIMAEKIAEGIEQAGCVVDIRSVEQVDPSEISGFDKIVFGCPSMGVEVLEEDEFEPFFEESEKDLKDKKIALFGSFGWGDGEWMDAWSERVVNKGAMLFEEGLMINTTPSSEEEETCVDFGKRFAAF